MRLTLRTLLAWLDDKLQPDQVSAIGRQVGESPLAQELVERIQRVTRQRRLTVPSQSGPDSTDPNLVAGYLDNDIEPEAVTAYEKKCLGSDVNLAEVASVHQILSNLGQKVHVPPEAKARMYTLVKGREAQPRPADPVAEAAPAKREANNEPIDPWEGTPRPRRRVLDRLGPIAAFVALLGLLIWSAYESLRPGPTPPRSRTAVAQAPDEAADQPEAEGREPRLAAVDPRRGAMDSADFDEMDQEETPEAEATDAAEESAEGAEDAQPKMAEAEADEPSPDVPDGAVGVVAKVDGMLLRYSAEDREWVRVDEGSGVEALDRLLVLPPFRARIALDGTVINLLPDTEVQITHRTKDEEPALGLSHGRVAITTAAGDRPIHITFGGRALDATPAAGATIGLQLMSAWRYGQPAGLEPILAIMADEGETALSVGEAKETLTGPGVVVVNSEGTFAKPDDPKLPDWWAQAKRPSAEDSVLIDKYLKQFSEDRPVLTDIASATDGEDLETKTLAINGLRALGDLSFLTPILDRPDDPEARRATIAALRDQLATGGQLASRGWEQLEIDFGDFDQPWLQKLFLGFNDEDAAKPKTYEELVQALSDDNNSIGVRELAFDNLKRLSGRTTIPYDADNPEAGHAAWKRLLDDGELRAAPK